MKVKTNIIITILVSAATFIGLYAYVPFSWYEKFLPKREAPLGASITTINATDTLRDSRSVINTNFDNLNKYKTETASTSIDAITTLSNLVTVGALTSGSLGAGFTEVAVARGGTGSTTLAANLVLLGNGTNQVAVVNGTGASGQVLKSNGAGVAPTWQSGTTDQTSNYIWSGVHIFDSTAPDASSSPAWPTTIRGDLLLEATATFSGFKATTTGFSIGGNNWEWFGSQPGTNSVAAFGAGGKMVGLNYYVDTLVPEPLLPLHASTTVEFQINTNTLMTTWAFEAIKNIILNKITLQVLAVGTSGTVDLCVYSEDGGTKEVDVTSGSISAGGLVSVTVGSVNLAPGVHYIAVVPNSTADVTLLAYNASTLSPFNNLSGEPTYSGDVTVSASACPSTFNPVSDLSPNNNLPIYRLDN